MKFFKTTAGFTLAELLVASTIFMISMMVMTSTGVNLYQNYRRQLARDNLYEETRTLLDRIAQEVHENTVDFDEYFNHLGTAQGGGASVSSYGDYYRFYYHNFFRVSPPVDSSPCTSLGLNDPARYNYEGTNPCRDQHINEGYFATGADDDTDDTDASDGVTSALNSALGGVNLQGELYLISSDGKQKSILKRVSGSSGVDQISMLKLDLKDQYDNATITPGPAQGGPDGYYDCWANNNDYPGRQFQPISPPNIEITALKFFISPIDDPKKAFNESDIKVQVHPNVTIVLTARVTPAEAKKFYSNSPPEITLETTVSSRIYENVLIPFGITARNPSGMCEHSLDLETGGSDGVTPPPPPSCNGSVRESGEECDGNDLGGQTCTTISGGFTGGSLSCFAPGTANQCTFNTASCTTGCIADPAHSGKCLICHVSGNGGSKKCSTQSVSQSGRDNHLNGGHGDFDGNCTASCAS